MLLHSSLLAFSAVHMSFFFFLQSSWGYDVAIVWKTEQHHITYLDDLIKEKIALQY